MSLFRLCVLCAAVAGAATAQDWPQWRGPARDGRVPGALPLTWPKALKAGWKVPVGLGYSSPVVSGRHVFTFARQGGDEVASSFDLDTGKLVWRQAYPAPYAVNPAAASHGPGPKSTPLVHAGRLYTLGIGGTLSSLEAASGRVVWRKDFKGQFRDAAPIYAPPCRRPSPTASCSPCGRRRRRRPHGVSTRGAGPCAGPGRRRAGYASRWWRSWAACARWSAQTEKQLWPFARGGRAALEPAFTTPYEQNSVTPVVTGTWSCTPGSAAAFTPCASRARAGMVHEPGLGTPTRSRST